MSEESNKSAPVLPTNRPDDALPSQQTVPVAVDSDGDPEPCHLPQTCVRDEHGFDPDEFEWRPVARRPRADGWKPEVQRAFIDALADTGMVEAAARAVDMSVASCYRLRRAPGAQSFARAWDVALEHASQHLIDIAFTRAIEGVEQPIFDRDGCRIGARRHYSDKLLLELLRAYRPERFRPPRPDGPTAREAPPAPATFDTSLLEQATTALSPVTPPDPHLLMEPAALDIAVDAARGVAEVYELYPPDDREPYAPVPIAPDHEAAQERRQQRLERRYPEFAKPPEKEPDGRAIASLSPHLPRRDGK